MPGTLSARTALRSSSRGLPSAWKQIERNKGPLFTLAEDLQAAIASMVLRARPWDRPRRVVDRIKTSEVGLDVRRYVISLTRCSAEHVYE